MTAPSTRRLLTRALTRTLLTPHPVEHYARSLGVSLADDPTGATVLSVERPVADVTVLTLRLPTGVERPAPGAALEIGVVVDGIIHRRHYSPVDSAHRSDGLATIAVHRHVGGTVSEHLWAEAGPGMQVLLGAPVGEIALPDDRPADLLLVSGGSGITPMLAIASTLVTERHPGRIAWLHYARSTGSVPFADRLRELARAGVALRVVPTAPVAGEQAAGGPTGRLCTEHLNEVAPWHHDAEVYLCGPDALAVGLETVLGTDRFPDVHRERFSAPTPPVSQGDGGAVTHLRSGITATNTGTTLLEGAEAAGLSPTHGCRMGICHTCIAVRVSGATRDLRTGDVSTEPGSLVQICVSAPVGDVQIDL